MPIWKFADLVAGRARFSSITQFRRPDNDLLEADPYNRFVYHPADVLGSDEVQALMPDAKNHADPSDLHQLAIPGDHTFIESEIFHSYIYRARAAWCWYGTERESALMWKVFAKDGIAIQTTLGALQNSLPDTREFEIGAMRYHTIRQAQPNSYNFEKDPKMLARPYFLKSDGFQDEHEVRIVTGCPVGDSSVMVPLGNTENLIQKIIISPYVEGGLRGHECKHAEVQMIWNSSFGSNSMAPVVPSLLNKDWLESENRKEKLREQLNIAHS